MQSSVGVGHTKIQLANIAVMVVSIPDPAREIPPLANESACMPLEDVTIDMVARGLRRDEDPQVFEAFHERVLPGVSKCVDNMSRADRQDMGLESKMLKIRTRE